MATGSVNMYDLLNQDEQHSKKPQVQDGPGKPDKSSERRSVPKSARPDASGVATGTAASAPRQRTDDRERSGRGGRGGARGGRGGYHGNASDGVHRNFDRKQGEHSKHAPGEARKGGNVGEVDNSHFAGSAAEFSAQDAAQVSDANADINGDLVMDMIAPVADPEDSKLSYDQFLASRSQVDDDINRQRREVIVPDADDENFKAAKPFQKKEEETFFDSVKSTKEDKSESSAAGGKKNKKSKISLDEFVGVSGPVAQNESGEREGARGGRGGARGGRGGFDGSAPRRGGRGGFEGESSRGGASRGGRGGRDGEAASSAPRGGRGGARGGRGGYDNAPRGGRGGAFVPRGAPAANVNIADQSAFPALSPK